MATLLFLPSPLLTPGRVRAGTSNLHPLNRAPVIHYKPTLRLTSNSQQISKATPDRVPRPSLQRILRSLYPFSRPHTIHGTIISVLSLTILSSLQTQTPFRIALLSLRSSLPPALLTNIYIVGLNQLYDIPLDRINKPGLPLPSGDLTPEEATLIVSTALILSLLSLCLASTNPLIIVVTGSIILGTAYSAPPFRLKRFAALASAAIMCVRGVLVNTCFFLHASTTTTLPFLIRFAITFFTLFGTVIALLKDVPDIPGDTRYGISTFSVTLGGDVVFNICVTVLVLLFLCGAAVYSFTAWTKIITGGIGVIKGVISAIGAILHLIVAKRLWTTASDVQVFERRSVTKYYMDSWKAFYLEYLLLPLAAL